MSDLPNIILIVLDTLRKDALGVYNGSMDTPAIDLFAQDSVVCSNAISPSPWTVPSHASFFTGKYPSAHGVHETDTIKMDNMGGIFSAAKGPTLVETLRKLGYIAVGYSANDAAVSPAQGFDRGFHHFSNTNSPDVRRLSEFHNEISRGFDLSVDSWLELAVQLFKKGDIRKLATYFLQQRMIKQEIRKAGFPRTKGGNIILNSVLNSTFEEPFFLFLNFMEMHEPYFNFLHKYLERTQNLFGLRRLNNYEKGLLWKAYRSRVRLVDSYFSKLIHHFKKSGIYDRSLIILVSDHGQDLKDNDYFGHMIFLHPQLINVPLLIKTPGNNKFPLRGYQSTVSVFDAIKGFAEGSFDPYSVSSDIAFSESYGYPAVAPIGMNRTRFKEFETSRRIHDIRKAVFKDGYKLVINGTTAEVEEFTLHGIPVDLLSHRDPYNDLKEELSIFSGTEKFDIP